MHISQSLVVGEYINNYYSKDNSLKTSTSTRFVSLNKINYNKFDDFKENLRMISKIDAYRTIHLNILYV